MSGKASCLLSKTWLQSCDAADMPVELMISGCQIHCYTIDAAQAGQ